MPCQMCLITAMSALAGYEDGVTLTMLYKVSMSCIGHGALLSGVRVCLPPSEAAARAGCRTAIAFGV